MKEISFKFNEPTLLKLDYKLNYENSSKENFKVNLKNEFELDILTENKKLSSPCGVKLCIKISSEEEKESLFNIYLEILSIFEWDNDIIDDEEVKKRLNSTAPELLLSYARPIIANLTQQSGLPSYHIPFINFNEKN